MSAPSRPLTRASRRRIVGCEPSQPEGRATSSVPSRTVAPVSSTSSLVATACASNVPSGESPFSKRLEASERSASRVEVRWMLGPSQTADSSSTVVVPSWTSERAPPITPASEVGPSASQITTMSGSSLRVSPSSVSSTSPSRPSRTISCPPATRSRSKACSGWPVSSIT